MESKSEINKEFNEVDKVLDRIDESNRKKVKEARGSNIEVREKSFMKISDVDREDMEWFKQFADKHTDRKQFLAIKVIRSVMETIEPLVENIMKNHNLLCDKVADLDGRLVLLEGVPESEKNKIVLPKTQGGGRK